jgi:hypothetical protein
MKTRMSFPIKIAFRRAISAIGVSVLLGGGLAGAANAQSVQLASLRTQTSSARQVVGERMVRRAPAGLGLESLFESAFVLQAQHIYREDESEIGGFALLPVFGTATVRVEAIRRLPEGLRVYVRGGTTAGEAVAGYLLVPQLEALAGSLELIGC